MKGNTRSIVALCLWACSAGAFAASETYPVTYAGGTPPPNINGAIDSDDSTMPNRPDTCSALTTNTSAAQFGYDVVQVTNAGANSADIVFTVNDLNNQCTALADSVVIVYNGAFTPATPLVNCESVNDDFQVGGGGCSRVQTTIAAGGTKTIVVTSKSPGISPPIPNRPGPDVPAGNGGLFGWVGGFGGTTPVALQSFEVK